MGEKGPEGLLALLTRAPIDVVSDFVRKTVRHDSAVTRMELRIVPFEPRNGTRPV